MSTGPADQDAHDPTEGARETHYLVDAVTRGQRRRADQLEALGRVLDGFESRLTTEVDRLGTRLDHVDGRLVGADARLDGLEERLTARLEGIEGSLAELLRRLPGAGR